MTSTPDQQPIKLHLPYMPGFKGAYERVRADPDGARILDHEAIPALEQAGPPEQRVKSMVAAIHKAMMAFANKGRQPTLDGYGLDPVETDLKLAFIDALSQAIADSRAQREVRRQALNNLLNVIRAPHPIGVPVAGDFDSWNITARGTAEATVGVHIDNLDKQ